MERKEEKSLSEQLEELQKALKAYEEKEKTAPKGAHLQVEDHMELAAKYLNANAQAALSKKGKHIIEQYNVDMGNNNFVPHSAVCQFFGVQVRKDKIEEGVKAVAEVMNELADMGAIHSCLAAISSIDLAQMMFKHATSVVICYVHIKPGFEETVRSFKYNVREGEIGPALHNLDIELPQGEFFAECRLSHQLAMMHPPKSNESRVFDVVKDYLKYLPEGTEFVGYRQTAIVDLSLPYELRFRNPLLQRVKRVELDYVRDVAFQNEGEKEQLKQFNLVTGIRYMGVRDFHAKDGKIEDLYRYNTAP